MKTAIYIGIVAVSCFVLNCAQVNEKINQEDLILGKALEKHQYKNLALFPVMTNAAFLEHRKGKGLYLTLNESVKENKVRVTERTHERRNQSNDVDQETETGADVNSLFIENISSDTVLILNGEIVSGGNQDRVIAEDIVLLPHSGQIDLAVFCVEQWRWEGDEISFCATEENIAPAKVRKAMKGGQEEVWETVAEQLHQNDLHSASFSINVMYEDQKTSQKIDDYLTRFKNIFNTEQAIVGMIAIADNKIVGCDLFATHDLFVRHFPNLLQSYATEALTAKNENGVKIAQVSEFLQAVKRKAVEEKFLLARGETKGKLKAHFSMH